MTTVEQSSIAWGRTTIHYEVRRSGRRRTVTLGVEPDGSVVVAAPEGVALARLDAVVLARAAWVVEHAASRTRMALAPAPREFVNGETFRYLGRQYRLRLAVGAPVAPLALRGGWLDLPVPATLATTHRSAYARAALMDWYRKHAERRLPALAAAWAARLGVPAPRVLIRDQAKRWGSCHPPSGVVRLNWRVVQAAPRVVDYIVAHEIAHLRHEGHGRAFWRTLEGVMPDAEARREQLADVGAELVW